MTNADPRKKNEPQTETEDSTSDQVDTKLDETTSASLKLGAETDDGKPEQFSSSQLPIEQEKAVTSNGADSQVEKTADEPLKPDLLLQIAELFKQIETQESLKTRLQSVDSIDLGKLGIKTKPITDGSLGSAVSFEFPHAVQVRGKNGVRTDFSKAPEQAPSFNGEKIETIEVTAPTAQNPAGSLTIKTASGTKTLTGVERAEFKMPPVITAMDQSGNLMTIFANGDKRIEITDGTKITQFSPLDSQGRTFQRETVSDGTKSTVLYQKDGSRSVDFDPPLEGGISQVSEKSSRGGDTVYDARIMAPPAVAEEESESTAQQVETATEGAEGRSPSPEAQRDPNRQADEQQIKEAPAKIANLNADATAGEGNAEIRSNRDQEVVSAVKLAFQLGGHKAVTKLLADINAEIAKRSPGKAVEFNGGVIGGTPRDNKFAVSLQISDSSKTAFKVYNAYESIPGLQVELNELGQTKKFLFPGDKTLAFDFDKTNPRRVTGFQDADGNAWIRQVKDGIAFFTGKDSAGRDIPGRIDGEISVGGGRVERIVNGTIQELTGRTDFRAEAQKKAPEGTPDAIADRPVEVYKPAVNSEDSRRLLDMQTRMLDHLSKLVDAKDPAQNAFLEGIQRERQEGVFGPESRLCLELLKGTVEANTKKLANLLSKAAVSAKTGVDLPFDPHTQLPMTPERYEAWLKDPQAVYKLDMHIPEKGLPSDQDLMKLDQSVRWLGDAQKRFEKAAADYQDKYIDRMVGELGLPQEYKKENRAKVGLDDAEGRRAALQMIEMFKQVQRTVDTAIYLNKQNPHSLLGIRSDLRLQNDANRFPIELPQGWEWRRNDKDQIDFSKDPPFIAKMPSDLRLAAGGNRETIDQVQKYLKEYGDRVKTTYMEIEQATGNPVGLLAYEDVEVPRSRWTGALGFNPDGSPKFKFDQRQGGKDDPAHDFNLIGMDFDVEKTKDGIFKVTRRAELWDLPIWAYQNARWNGVIGSKVGDIKMPTREYKAGTLVPVKRGDSFELCKVENLADDTNPLLAAVSPGLYIGAKMQSYKGERQVVYWGEKAVTVAMDVLMTLEGLNGLRVGLAGLGKAGLKQVSTAAARVTEGGVAKALPAITRAERAWQLSTAGVKFSMGLPVAMFTSSAGSHDGSNKFTEYLGHARTAYFLTEAGGGLLFGQKFGRILNPSTEKFLPLVKTGHWCHPESGYAKAIHNGFKVAEWGVIATMSGHMVGLARQLTPDAPAGLDLSQAAKQDPRRARFEAEADWLKASDQALTDDKSGMPKDKEDKVRQALSTVESLDRTNREALLEGGFKDPAKKPAEEDRWGDRVTQCQTDLLVAKSELETALKKEGSEKPKAEKLQELKAKVAETEERLAIAQGKHTLLTGIKSDIEDRDPVKRAEELETQLRSARERYLGVTQTDTTGDADARRGRLEANLAHLKNETPPNTKEIARCEAELKPLADAKRDIEQLTTRLNHLNEFNRVRDKLIDYLQPPQSVVQDLIKNGKFETQKAAGFPDWRRTLDPELVVAAKLALLRLGNHDANGKLRDTLASRSFEVTVTKDGKDTKETVTQIINKADIVKGLEAELIKPTSELKHFTKQDIDALSDVKTDAHVLAQVISPRDTINAITKRTQELLDPTQPMTEQQRRQSTDAFKRELLKHIPDAALKSAKDTEKRLSEIMNSDRAQPLKDEQVVKALKEFRDSLKGNSEVQAAAIYSLMMLSRTGDGAIQDVLARDGHRSVTRDDVGLYLNIFLAAAIKDEQRVPGGVDLVLANLLSKLDPSAMPQTRLAELANDVCRRNPSEQIKDWAQMIKMGGDLSNQGMERSRKSLHTFDMGEPERLKAARETIKGFGPGMTAHLKPEAAKEIQTILDKTAELLAPEAKKTDVEKFKNDLSKHFKAPLADTEEAKTARAAAGLAMLYLNRDKYGNLPDNFARSLTGETVVEALKSDFINTKTPESAARMIALGDMLSRAGIVSGATFAAKLQDVLLDPKVSQEDKMRALVDSNGPRFPAVIEALRVHEALKAQFGKPEDESSTNSFGVSSVDLLKTLERVSKENKGTPLAALAADLKFAHLLTDAEERQKQLIEISKAGTDVVERRADGKTLEDQFVARMKAHAGTLDKDPTSAETLLAFQSASALADYAPPAEHSAQAAELQTLVNDTFLFLTSGKYREQEQLRVKTFESLDELAKAKGENRPASELQALLKAAIDAQQERLSKEQVAEDLMIRSLERLLPERMTNLAKDNPDAWLQIMERVRKFTDSPVRPDAPVLPEPHTAADVAKFKRDLEVFRKHPNAIPGRERMHEENQARVLSMLPALINSSIGDSGNLTQFKAGERRTMHDRLSQLVTTKGMADYPLVGEAAVKAIGAIEFTDLAQRAKHAEFMRTIVQDREKYPPLVRRAALEEMAKLNPPGLERTYLDLLSKETNSEINKRVRELILPLRRPEPTSKDYMEDFERAKRDLMSSAVRGNFLTSSRSYLLQNHRILDSDFAHYEANRRYNERTGLNNNNPLALVDIAMTEPLRQALQSVQKDQLDAITSLKTKAESGGTGADEARKALAYIIMSNGMPAVGTADKDRLVTLAAQKLKEACEANPAARSKDFAQILEMCLMHQPMMSVENRNRLLDAMLVLKPGQHEGGVTREQAAVAIAAGLQLNLARTRGTYPGQNSEFQTKAIAALAELGVAKVLPVLEAVANADDIEHKDESVVQAARKAVSAMRDNTGGIESQVKELMTTHQFSIRDLTTDLENKIGKNANSPELVRAIFMAGERPPITDANDARARAMSHIMSSPNESEQAKIACAKVFSNSTVPELRRRAVELLALESKHGTRQGFRDDARTAFEKIKVAGKDAEAVDAANKLLASPPQPGDARSELTSRALTSPDTAIRLEAAQNLLKSDSEDIRKKAIEALSMVAKHGFRESDRKLARDFLESVKAAEKANPKTPAGFHAGDSKLIDETIARVSKLTSSDLVQRLDGPVTFGMLDRQRYYDGVKRNMLDNSYADLKRFEGDWFRKNPAYSLLDGKNLIKTFDDNFHRVRMQFLNATKGTVTILADWGVSALWYTNPITPFFDRPEHFHYNPDDEIKEADEKSVRDRDTQFKNLVDAASKPDGQEARMALAYIVSSNGMPFNANERTAFAMKAGTAIKDICKDGNLNRGELTNMIAACLTDQPDMHGFTRKELLLGLRELRTKSGGNVGDEEFAAIVTNALEIQFKTMPVPGAPGFDKNTYDWSIHLQRHLLKDLESMNYRKATPILEAMSQYHPDSYVQDWARGLSMRFADRLGGYKQEPFDGEPKFETSPAGETERLKWRAGRLSDAIASGDNSKTISAIVSSGFEKPISATDDPRRPLLRMCLDSNEPLVRMAASRLLLTSQSNADPDRERAYQVMKTLSAHGSTLWFRQDATDILNGLNGGNSDLRARAASEVQIERSDESRLTQSIADIEAKKGRTSDELYRPLTQYAQMLRARNSPQDTEKARGLEQRAMEIGEQMYQRAQAYQDTQATKSGNESPAIETMWKHSQYLRQRDWPGDSQKADEIQKQMYVRLDSTWNKHIEKMSKEFKTPPTDAELNKLAIAQKQYADSMEGSPDPKHQEHCKQLRTESAANLVRAWDTTIGGVEKEIASGSKTYDDLASLYLRESKFFKDRGDTTGETQALRKMQESTEKAWQSRIKALTDREADLNSKETWQLAEQLTGYANSLRQRNWPGDNQTAERLTRQAGDAQENSFKKYLQEADESSGGTVTAQKLGAMAEYSDFLRQRNQTGDRENAKSLDEQIAADGEKRAMEFAQLKHAGPLDKGTIDEFMQIAEVLEKRGKRLHNYSEGHSHNLSLPKPPRGEELPYGHLKEAISGDAARAFKLYTLGHQMKDSLLRKTTERAEAEFGPESAEALKAIKAHAQFLKSASEPEQERGERLADIAYKRELNYWNRHAKIAAGSGDVTAQVEALGKKVHVIQSRDSFVYRRSDELETARAEYLKAREAASESGIEIGYGRDFEKLTVASTDNGDSHKSISKETQNLIDRVSSEEARPYLEALAKHWSMDSTSLEKVLSAYGGNDIKLERARQLSRACSDGLIDGSTLAAMQDLPAEKRAIAEQILENQLSISQQNQIDSATMKKLMDVAPQLSVEQLRTFSTSLKAAGDGKQALLDGNSLFKILSDSDAAVKDVCSYLQNGAKSVLALETFIALHPEDRNAALARGLQQTDLERALEIFPTENVPKMLEAMGTIIDKPLWDKIVAYETKQAKALEDPNGTLGPLLAGPLSEVVKVPEINRATLNTVADQIIQGKTTEDNVTVAAAAAQANLLSAEQIPMVLNLPEERQTALISILQSETSTYNYSRKGFTRADFERILQTPELLDNVEKLKPSSSAEPARNTPPVLERSDNVGTSQNQQPDASEVETRAEQATDDTRGDEVEKTPAQQLAEFDANYERVLKQLDTEISTELLGRNLVLDVLIKAQRESVDIRMKTGSSMAHLAIAESQKDAPTAEKVKSELAEMLKLDQQSEARERQAFDHLPDATKARSMRAALQIASGKDAEIAAGEVELGKLVKDNPKLATSKEFRELLLLSYSQMAAARQLRGLGEWQSTLAVDDIWKGKTGENKPGDPLELLSKANEAFFDEGIDKASPLFKQAVEAQTQIEAAANRQRLELFISSIKQDAKIAHLSQSGKDVDELIQKRIAHGEQEARAIDQSSKNKDTSTSIKINYAFARIATGKDELFEEALNDLKAELRENPAMSFDDGFKQNLRQAFQSREENKKPAEAANAQEPGAAPKEPGGELLKPQYNNLDLKQIVHTDAISKDAKVESYTSDDLTTPALVALALGITLVQYRRTSAKYHAAKVMRESQTAESTIKPIAGLDPNVRTQRTARSGEQATFEIKGTASDGRVVLVREANPAAVETLPIDLKEVKPGAAFDPVKMQTADYLPIEVNGKKYYADKDGRVFKYEKKIFSEGRLFEDVETRQIELVNRTDVKSALPELAVVPESILMTHENPQRSLPSEWQKEFELIRDVKRAVAANDVSPSERMETLTRAAVELSLLPQADRARYVSEIKQQLEQVGLNIEVSETPGESGAPKIKISLSEQGSNRRINVSSDRTTAPELGIKDKAGEYSKANSTRVKAVDELARLEGVVAGNLKRVETREKLQAWDPELAADASAKEVRSSFLDGLGKPLREAREAVIEFQDAVRTADGASAKVAAEQVLKRLESASPEVKQRVSQELERAVKAIGESRPANTGEAVASLTTKVDTLEDAKKNYKRKLELLEGQKNPSAELKAATSTFKQVEALMNSGKITPTAAIEIQNLIARGANGNPPRALTPEGLSVLAQLDPKVVTGLSDFPASSLITGINKGRLGVAELNQGLPQYEAFNQQLELLKSTYLGDSVRTPTQASQLIEMGLAEDPVIRQIFTDRTVSKAGVDALLNVLQNKSTGNSTIDKIFTPQVVDRLRNSQLDIDHKKLLEATSLAGDIATGNLDRSPSVVAQLLESNSAAVRDISRLIRNPKINSVQMDAILKDVVAQTNAKSQYSVAFNYNEMTPRLLERVLKVENAELRTALAQQASRIAEPDKIDAIEKAHGVSPEAGELIRAVLLAPADPRFDKVALLDKVLGEKLSAPAAAKLAKAMAGEKPLLSVEQVQLMMGDSNASRDAAIDLIGTGKVNDGKLIAEISGDRDGKALAKAIKDGAASETEIRGLLDKEAKNNADYTRQPILLGEETEAAAKPDFSANDAIREQIERIRTVLKANADGQAKLAAGQVDAMLKDPVKAFDAAISLPDAYHADPALARIQRKALTYLDDIKSHLPADDVESMRKFIETETGQLHSKNPSELAARMKNFEFLIAEMKLNPKPTNDVIERYARSVFHSSQYGQAESRALISGIRSRISGGFEVHVHGSSHGFALTSTALQGENFNPNHPAKSPQDNGRIFTGTLEVATEFSARLIGDKTRSKGTDSSALVGIALPIEVANELKTKELLWTRKLIDRDALETIIEPGALEIIKEKGYIFPLDTSTHVTLVEGVEPGKRGLKPNVYSVPREAYEKILAELPSKHIVKVTDTLSGKEQVRVRAGHEADVARLILDAAKSSGFKPLKFDSDGRLIPEQKTGERVESRTGTHYEEMPRTADREVAEINRRVAEVFENVSRRRFESMDPVERQKLVDTAVERILPLMKQYAKRLGLPEDLVTKQNLTFDSLKGAGGVYLLEQDKIVIDIKQEFSANEAFHELVHKMRALDVKAAFAADPAGAKLAMMDKMLSSGSTRIRVGDTLVARPQFENPALAAEFKQHVEYRILKQMHAAGEIDAANVPPQPKASAELLKSFGTSEAALNQAISNELTNFNEAVELVQKSKLTPESAKYVEGKAAAYKRWLEAPAKAQTELESAPRTMRNNPYLNKLLQTASIDRAARTEGGAAEYSFSNEEIVARKTDIAERARRLNRELKSGSQTGEQASVSRQSFNEFVEYLRMATEQQRINNALASSEPAEARALALKLQEKLASNVEVNKSYIDYLLMNNVLKPDELHEAFKGFESVGGRARAIAMDRFARGAFASGEGISSVETGEGYSKYLLKEPLKLFTGTTEEIKVEAVRVNNDGKMFVEVVDKAGKHSVEPIEEHWIGTDQKSFENDFAKVESKVAGEAGPKKVGLFLEYMRQLNLQERDLTRSDSESPTTAKPEVVKPAQSTEFDPRTSAEQLDKEALERAAKSTERIGLERKFNKEAKALDHMFSQSMELTGPDGKTVKVKGIRTALDGGGEPVYLVEGKDGKVSANVELTTAAKARINTNPALAEGLKDPVKALEVMSNYAQASTDVRSNVTLEAGGMLIDYRLVATAAQKALGGTAVVEGTTVRFQSEAGIPMVVKFKPERDQKLEIKEMRDADLTDEKLAKLLEGMKISDPIVKEKLESYMKEYLKDHPEAKDLESCQKILAKQIRDGKAGEISGELKSIFKEFGVELENGKPKFENGHLVLRPKTGTETTRARMAGGFERAKGKLVPIMMIVLAVAHQSQDHSTYVVPNR